MTSATTNQPSTAERADLIDSLRRHRGFLRSTVEGITDEQARQRSTVSELTLGGLIKHVASTEASWATFMVDGGADEEAIDWESVDWSNPPAEVIARMNDFVLGDDETVADALARYDEVAARTDQLVAELANLDDGHALPDAPWFEPNTVWSARRVVLHIIAETSQHAGHADILREAIDGHKTMG